MSEIKKNSMFLYIISIKINSICKYGYNAIVPILCTLLIWKKHVICSYKILKCETQKTLYLSNLPFLSSLVCAKYNYQQLLSINVWYTIPRTIHIRLPEVKMSWIALWSPLCELTKTFMCLSGMNTSTKSYRFKDI